MRRIPKGCCIAAALLLLWAAVDFRSYLFLGRDLVAHYPDTGSIHSMVQDKLLQGIVKAVLGAAILAVGWFRCRERPPLRSLTAVTLLLLLAVMGTWFAAMACLTVVTAQEIYDQLYEESRDFPDSVSRTGLLDEFYDQSFNRYGYHHERPDFWEHQLLEAIAHNTSARHRSEGDYGSGDRSKLIRDMDYPMETAVLFYDGEGNLLHSSEEDLLYFSYFTQEEWDAGRDTTYGLHYGWMDISGGKGAADPAEDPWGALRQLYAGGRLPWQATLRVVGAFDGTELIPVTVHYITDEEIRRVVEDTDQFSTGPDSYSYIVSDVDRTGRLEWQLLFDRSGEHQGEDLAVFYLDQPDMWDYQGTPLRYGYETYESLAALTEELDFPSRAGMSPYSSELREAGILRLNELLVFGSRDYADYEGYDYSAGGEPETEFTLVTAIRSRPLACAVSALRNIYIATGLLALALVLAVRSQVRRRLVEPVSAAAEAMADGWGDLCRRDDGPSLWREAERLAAGYTAEREWRRMKDNELTRLNTALTYARTAEENRRRMVSNIAHELKTPLAVIHSYAEGLKEHAAEEKRDRYLEVILSEAERTDGMVMEMLDLSRLEAGKVKLSRDTVSLEALTRGVFEKLERQVRARDLHVSLSFPEACVITADESRMAQVIENLATNAVRYTPAGGHVAVGMQNQGRRAAFTMENDCAPLSEQTLERVWDSFYRADAARSGGGTGLGLAIVKSIVELHGGTCFAHSTASGVVFGFTIPR